MFFQRSGIRTLKRGIRLRYPLRDGQGILLLAQGAEVNERVHNLLLTRGIQLDLQASLKVTEGGPAGLEIPLRKDQLLIGRRPDCDVQLPSALVSGHHCRLRKREIGVFVEDLASVNGTYVNGARVRGEEELSDGDSLRVADGTFAVQLFAALAASSEEGTRALKAWILEESAIKRRAASPYSATEPDICI